MTARLFIGPKRIDIPEKHVHTGPCRCIKIPAQDQHKRKE